MLAVPCLLLGVAMMASGQEPARLDEAAAGRFAALALDCVHKEYPNKIAHVLTGDQDVRPPRELTPAFYGCYDWHSSVHGHWLLVRLARTFPAAPFAAKARAAVAQSLTPEHIAGEVKYLTGAGRASFERPYGLAWLLQLAAELREWNDPQAREWAATLKPLEDAAVQRLKDWLPKLSKPIRIGEHDQTAFSFGLILDWARIAGDRGDGAVARRPHPRLLPAGSRLPVLVGAHRAGLPVAVPGRGRPDAAGAARRRVRDVARRVPARHPEGRQRRVADAGRRDRSHRPEAGAPRRAQPQPGVDARGDRVGAAAGRRTPAVAAGGGARHREAGLRAVTGEHYEGGHWLGSFAVYLDDRDGGSSVDCAAQNVGTRSPS